MKFLAILILTLALLTSALPQIGVGGGSGTVVTVYVTPRMQAVSYDATNHKQTAAYGVEADVASPSPWMIFTYEWSGAGLTFDDIHAQATTAHVSGGGAYLASCYVSGIDLITGMTVSINEAKDLFAVGGPIIITKDGGELSTFEHDKDLRSNSWYLQYFGYTHAAAKPEKAQITQNARAIVGLQPAGTVVTWTLGTGLYSSALAANPHATNIDISAEQACSDVTITAHFSFTNSDGSISTDDDTPSSMEAWPGVDDDFHPMVYKLSGHKPDHLGDPTIATVTAASGLPNYWTNVANYTYRLYDTTGDAMPGVYVQERFTDGNPLGLTVNDGKGSAWQTKMLTLNNGIESGEGLFNAPDTLWYRWPPGVVPTLSVTTVHHYFAGTYTSILADTSGIDLGAYTITFAPGQPGTASQVKN